MSYHYAAKKAVARGAHRTATPLRSTPSVHIPKEPFVRRVAVCLGSIAAAAVLAVPATAMAAEVLTASPSLAGKLGGAGTLTIRANVTDSLGGIPSPLTQLVIDIPPGVTYNFATTPVCPLATIQAATGSVAPSCPTGSKIGGGTATVQAVLGGEGITETAAMDIYLLQRSPVTYQVWANGTTPIQETLNFPGSFSPTSAPYAQQISVNVPPIPTVPGGPDASVTGLDFAVGGSHTATVKKGKKKVKESVPLFTLPKTCKGGTLPYAATATFEDASVVPVTGKVACP